MSLGGTVLLLAVGLILSVLVYGARPFARWKLRHIPGPKHVWLIGGLGDIVRKQMRDATLDWAKVHGKVYKVFLGAFPLVVVSDAVLAKKVNLAGQLRPPNFGPSLVLPKDPHSLLWVDSVDHHRSLKMGWLPAFYSDSLAGYWGEMKVGAERLGQQLSVAASQRHEVDLWSMLGRMTMEVTANSAFGMDLKMQLDDDKNSEEGNQLIDGALHIFQNTGNASVYILLAMLLPIINPVLRMLAVIFPDKPLSVARAAQNLFRSTLAPFCREARERADEKQNGAHLQNGSVEGGRSEAIAKGARKGIAPGSFMYQMVGAKHKDGRGFTDAEALSQASTFLLAGYETTASALAFTCYLLSRHPDKAANLYLEIDKFGREKVPTAADLEELPYLNGVLKESMRVLPPAFLTARKLDQQLQLDTYVLPSGTWVFTHIDGIQHDPAYWKDPDEFIPERWIDGTPEAADRPPMATNAWTAFGEGGLACVGSKFALQEAKLTLVHLLQRFTFVLSPGQEKLALRSAFNITPARGVFVTPVLRL